MPHVSLVQMLLVQESSCALGRTISIVQSDLVSVSKLQLVRKRLNPVLPLTQVLGATREREQVAAVCYRVRRLKVEFLLVRTRKGKWTFPKGGVVGGLTRAQSAALEAFEEGGVHGRIERASFTRYILRKRRSSQTGEITIDAYLCEVLRLGTPQEVNRTPTWFTAEEAQLRLREGRTAEDAGELARVVDRAVSRLERLTQRNSNGRLANMDPLQKVHFEAPDNLGGRLVARVALLSYPQAKRSRSSQLPIIEFGDDSPKILQLGPGRPPGR
jgi:8-oxo-dGTP pyrophosphatase MutT (NUDIX family)